MHEFPVLIEDLGRIYPTKKSKKKERYGMYECVFCKEPYRAREYNVRKRKSNSCKYCNGVNKADDKVSKLRVHTTWNNMMQRCNNKNNPDYVNYGDRGIVICKEWHDFRIFKVWALNNGYKENLTIERIDVNGGYNSINCCFIPKEEQAKNKRNTIRKT